MKIESIFANDYGSLLSIKYNDQIQDEFNRLFDLWSDTQYLFTFCKQNEQTIFNDYYRISRLEDFVDKIKNEAWVLESMFLDYFNNEAGERDPLSIFFLPYHPQEYALSVLQLSKAKVIDRRVQKPALRLYALRLDNNNFIITGGCIKTTEAVQECQYNMAEIAKMNAVRNRLRAKNIEIYDDLIYYYEE